MQTHPDAGEDWTAPASALAPAHYRQDRTDLYAAFIATFGFEAWAQHAEMECLQYLWRCRQKGSYAEDIHKVLVICQRILEEHTCQQAHAQGKDNI